LSWKSGWAFPTGEFSTITESNRAHSQSVSGGGSVLTSTMSDHSPPAPFWGGWRNQPLSFPPSKSDEWLMPPPVTEMLSTAKAPRTVGLPPSWSEYPPSDRKQYFTAIGPGEDGRVTPGWRLRDCAVRVPSTIPV